MPPLISYLHTLWDSPVTHLSAIAYNLKKYLKFKGKRVKSGAGKLALATIHESILKQISPASIEHGDLTYNF